MSFNKCLFLCILNSLHGPKLSWRRQWQPTPVLLPGESYGRRSLVGCSPWGRWGSDMPERLHFHFSLSCIGEGDGNPLQYSCLENPRDGGAWWAAVYGVAQSRTWLKRLSSSRSSVVEHLKFPVFFPLTLLWLIPGLGKLNLSHHWFLYILCVKHAFFFFYTCKWLKQQQLVLHIFRVLQ